MCLLLNSSKNDSVRVCYRLDFFLACNNHLFIDNNAYKTKNTIDLTGHSVNENCEGNNWNFMYLFHIDTDWETRIHSTHTVRVCQQIFMEIVSNSWYNLENSLKDLIFIIAIHTHTTYNWIIIINELYHRLNRMFADKLIFRVMQIGLVDRKKNKWQKYKLPSLLQCV